MRETNSNESAVLLQCSHIKNRVLPKHRLPADIFSTRAENSSGKRNQKDSVDADHPSFNLLGHARRCVYKHAKEKKTSLKITTKTTKTRGRKKSGGGHFARGPCSQVRLRLYVHPHTLLPRSKKHVPGHEKRPQAVSLVLQPHASFQQQPKVSSESTTLCDYSLHLVEPNDLYEPAATGESVGESL